MTTILREPVIKADAWRPLFTPHKTGCYVNDHTVFQDHAGRWHVIGITKATPDIEPDMERYFCHGSGKSLAKGGFEEHDKICDFGTRAWAPTVAHNGERYVMLYGPDLMRAAVSDELTHWRLTPCSVSGCPIDGNIRDQMIFRLDDDTWLMYSTSLRQGCGMISVFVSEDLLNWRFVRYALKTTPTAPTRPPWGATESPFVFYLEGYYYLSITYCSEVEDYNNTLIFRSVNPFDFGIYTGDESEPFARLHAHAPEYIFDSEADQWYITSCGWPNERFHPVIPGSVAITELNWAE